ncbi:MAG: Unknown protein [uncultured Campylobacterales bacterium]|uniref:Uncharacterized protein n=1 Tax=uncultured Campylobacterales bacterium TaxID=352960 RepID=A0A6S6S513_9BACT|nr:MAG: Unknown protein [uncultured Campylobacterales bacterium]
MLLDHFSKIVYSLMVFDIVGRLAFPMFMFMFILIKSTLWNYIIDYNCKKP